MSELPQDVLDLLRDVKARAGSHGCQLSETPARSRARFLGLIEGRRGKIGHAKVWSLTAEGREALS